ncbi:hypothetical protein Dimus_021914 [Dionaea muscipula]
MLVATSLLFFTTANDANPVLPLQRAHDRTVVYPKAADAAFSSGSRGSNAHRYVVASMDAPAHDGRAPGARPSSMFSKSLTSFSLNK